MSPELHDAESGSRSERQGIVAGLSAYVLWGIITVYWKALHDFAPLELIGYRIFLSALLLVAILAVRQRLGTLFRTLNEQRLWGRIVLTSILLAINWTTYVVVVHQGKVIEAALGYFIAPLGTMLLGVVVLHEKLRPLQKASAALATFAVLVLTWGYGQVPFFALAMALSWALYGLLKRQIILAPVESLMSETMILIVPAIALIVSFGRHEDSVPHAASALQWTLVLLAGVVTAVPLLLFASAAHKLPLTVLGPLQYSVPVINFLLGWLAYDEQLTPSRVAGFGLIWIALIIITIDSLIHNRGAFQTMRALRSSHE